MYTSGKQSVKPPSRRVAFSGSIWLGRGGGCEKGRNAWSLRLVSNSNAKIRRKS